MADAYLAISQIASDQHVTERVNAAATQQAYLGSAPAIASVGNQPLGLSALDWVANNRYVWASSPGWGEKWDYALASHPDDPDYQPGRDPAVITDGDILATVQALGA